MSRSKSPQARPGSPLWPEGKTEEPAVARGQQEVSVAI